MTHTQTERGRNQIRADLRLSQTTPVLLLFDESRHKHARGFATIKLQTTNGDVNSPIPALLLLLLGKQSN